MCVSRIEQIRRIHVKCMTNASYLIALKLNYYNIVLNFMFTLRILYILNSGSQIQRRDSNMDRDFLLLDCEILRKSSEIDDLNWALNVFR